MFGFGKKKKKDEGTDENAAKSPLKTGTLSGKLRPKDVAAFAAEPVAPPSTFAGMETAAPEKSSAEIEEEIKTDNITK